MSVTSAAEPRPPGPPPRILCSYIAGAGCPHHPRPS